jgi:hypothetical protein
MKGNRETRTKTVGNAGNLDIGLLITLYVNEVGYSTLELKLID